MGKSNGHWRRPWTLPTTEVLYTEQDLTPEEKAQARTNIGAIGKKDVENIVDAAIAKIPDYNGEVEDV